ncbi:four helix bundle protein [Patescibacteria group bacterium]|nr:four helix bundle protein [Patescibacteria group bacterium]
MAIKSFLDLDVYEESFGLSLEIEDLIKEFPRREEFLLTDQMRRASRAIPALIAEGYAKRETVAVFKKFLRDAIGEANEMINHIAFAKARKYLSPNKADELIERYNVVGRKLTKLKENWRKF